MFFNYTKNTEKQQFPPIFLFLFVAFGFPQGCICIVIISFIFGALNGKTTPNTALPKILPIERTAYQIRLQNHLFAGFYYFSISSFLLFVCDRCVFSGPFEQKLLNCTFYFAAAHIAFHVSQFACNKLPKDPVLICYNSATRLNHGIIVDRVCDLRTFDLV